MVTNHEKLTGAETLDLFRQLRATGDPAIRERLILANIPLAKRVAGRVKGLAPPRISPADLISEACVALIVAVDGFDLGRGVAFSTYAYKDIRLRLMDMIAMHGGPVPTSYYGRSEENRVRRTRKKLAAAGLDDSRRSAMDAMGWGEGRRLAATRYAVVSFDRGWVRSDGPDGDSNVEQISEESARMSAPASRESRLKVARILRRLRPVERDALRYTFGVGGRPAVSQKEAAGMAGVTETCISSAFRRAIYKLRAAG